MLPVRGELWDNAHYQGLKEYVGCGVWGLGCGAGWEGAVWHVLPRRRRPVTAGGEGDGMQGLRRGRPVRNRCVASRIFCILMFLYFCILYSTLV